MSLQAMTGRRIPTNRAAELKQESIPSSCDDHQPASLKIEGPEAATSESSSMSGDDDQQKRSVIEDRETPPSESDESDKAFSEGIQELNDETGRTETATPVPVEVEGSESPVSEQSDQPVTLEGKPITTPYVETDLEMSELAEQMNRAIAFSAPVVASVQVRKGYMFDLEVSGPEFWRKHDDVWSNRKRKRDNCFTHEQRHGFFAADIIKYGAVDMLNPRESNLTNDIHPLYARDSFNGCEDEVYEQFLPALRLASMWMTQPICFQFWVTLAMGKREIDKTMSQRFGRLQHRIRHDVALTEEDATNVIEYIKEISENYRMSFTFQDNFKRHGATYFGGTNKVCDIGWSDSERPTDRLLHIFTKLSSDYYVAAKKLSQLKYPDLTQVLRFQFGLAVLLVHETCHAIELAHIRKRPEVVPDEAYDPQWEQWIGHEPYFYDSVRPELGLTWEMYMFGGRILPINDRVDCLHGLCVFDWPDKNAAFDPNSREVHTIPMTYIKKMFQMETWQQKFDLSKDNVWHIPRDGAKSIYLTHFTTMSYDEEQRIKDEEATEALRAATGKWEKPADKKRRTSLDGEMLVASTSSPDVGKEPSDEVKADKDRLWKAALDYLRAQPRKPDTSLQGEEDWPEWVNECLRTMSPGNLIQAGISIAQSQSEDDEVPPNKAKQSAKDERKRNKPRKSGISNARKGEMGRHYTSAARAVGLGTEDGTEDKREREGGWMDSSSSFDGRYLRKVRAVYRGGDDDGEEDDDLDDRPQLLDGTATEHQIPTSVLYVNHQINIEASQVFYTSNRIPFDISAEFIIRFLSSLPSTTRSRIRHLGFGRHSTAADDYNCTKYWNSLCSYIKRHLQISPVTVQIPHDAHYCIDWNKKYGKQAYVKFFWWPAAFALRDMLMDRKIQELRLAHAQTYLLDDNEEEDAEVEVDECDFAAIKLLQYPRRKEEIRRERQECREYRRAEREGRSHTFQSRDALKEYQRNRRERLDLVARREDDTFGDFGTAIVLTRHK